MTSVAFMTDVRSHRIVFDPHRRAISADQQGFDEAIQLLSPEVTEAQSGEFEDAQIVIVQGEGEYDSCIVG
ncbi:MAG: hypothetical protein WBC18_17765 [Ottowia sp.]|uniref:hypothetical protein n=1 Tax=Ottowia sp. TaxID=1898956 RepID=UPI003C76E389